MTDDPRPQDNPHDGLRDAFRAGSVAHLAIDMNRFYCDASLDYPLGRKEYSFRSAGRVMRLVDDFADTIRAQAMTFWVTHRIGSHEKFILFNEPDIEERRRRSLQDILAESRQIFGRPKPACDTVIEKPGFDSFTDTDLGLRLCRAGITHVILTGQFKEHCVFETAKQGQRLGYQMVVVDDLCAWTQHTQKYRRMNKAFFDRKLDTMGALRMKSGRVCELAGPEA